MAGARAPFPSIRYIELTVFRSLFLFPFLGSVGMLRSLARYSEGKQLKPFPRVYFDLKAFRKGISEKKQSLIEAERRMIDKTYAYRAPDGWTIETFLTRAKILEDDSQVAQLASCFESWSDFISSSRKDLMRVSHLLPAHQVKKLALSIELFNRGLFGLSSSETREAFRGRPLRNQGVPWSPEDDEKLIQLAVYKYDFTFGDVWLYVSGEMERPIDDVRDRFVEVYLKKTERAQLMEIVLSKSFRPLLMNRQFRLLPPQCFVIPSRRSTLSQEPLPLPPAFTRYRSEAAFQ
jgi:hypothetical protein